MRTKRSWKNSWLILVVLAVFLLSQLSIVRSLTWSILAGPVGQATRLARITRTGIDTIRSIRTLGSENLALIEDNKRLQASIEKLQEVAHENDLLRQELGFANSSQDRFTYVLANVIGRGPSNALQTITLDKGSEDGLTVGLAVISQGFMIGQIKDLTTSTAQIQLVTGSHSRIPVILSRSRSTGILKGGLAGLTGEEFLKDISIEAGEEVLTSALGQIVPSDIPVGTIEQKLSLDTDLVRRASVHSPIEFGKLELVMVVKPK